MPHFCRVFKREMGIGLPAYFARLRATAAAELLASSGLSVKEVAAAVGFASASRLDRVFVDVFAASPTEYRARSRKAGQEKAIAGKINALTDCASGQKNVRVAAVTPVDGRKRQPMARGIK